MPGINRSIEVELCPQYNFLGIASQQKGVLQLREAIILLTCLGKFAVSSPTRRTRSRITRPQVANLHSPVTLPLDGRIVLPAFRAQGEV